MSTMTRLRILLAAIILGHLVLAGRLFQLTVIQGRTYRDQARNRCQKRERLPARRGRILDRHGQLLAVDEPAWDLHVRITELTGVGSIRRTARLVRESRQRLTVAVQALEAQVSTLAASAGGRGQEQVRNQAYRVPLALPSVGTLAAYELGLAGREHAGFSLHQEQDGSWSLYCNPWELRGYGARERVVALVPDLTVADLNQRIELKLTWIEGKIDERLGSRKDDRKRRQEVWADLAGWALPVLYDVPAELGRALTLHPEDFAGFEVEAQPIRRYPHGDCAIHLLGLVGKFQDQPEERQVRLGETEDYHHGEFVGLLGVERAFEERLHGQSGLLRYERRRRGGGKKILDRDEPDDGEDLVLTIDVRLQRAAEAALDATGRPGAAVLLEARTGAVLALASSPRYDPQDYFKNQELHTIKPSLLIDRAVWRSVPTPPGSSFKILTAIAGLESGAITPETTFVCSPGNTKRPRCQENHSSTPGPQNLEQALTRSCNVYFAETAQACGNELQVWIWKLGFWQPTGIEVSEQSCDNTRRDLRGARGAPLRRMVGIGQVIETTPLQIARLTAVVANDGYLVTPHVDATRHPPRPRPLGLHPGTLPAVRRGLEGVVDRGTAAGCGLDALRAAGKTGSAEVRPDPDTGRTKTHAWFTGYAPREKPEVVVTVLLEHAGHGGHEAAPVAARILRAYADLSR